jgi:nucleoside-diphosphate-sugar epimerase
MRLFCFGFGYTATVLAERLSDLGGVSVAGTRTRVEGGEPVALAAFQGDSRSETAARLLEGATHVLVSIPPDLEGCPALRLHGGDLAQLGSLAWVGYLSTVGVYGDAAGAWVDETSPVRPTSERALRRFQAEQGWVAFGRAHGVRVEVFRLPGIYGPGRSVIDSLRAGTAKRVVKPGQVFNRVHVVDIARALEAAMETPSEFDLYNVTDDEPAPPQDVVAYAAELLGMAAPPEIAFEASSLSPMAASFYSENKRVRNERLKRALAFTLKYPSYREGLLAIATGG